MRLKFSIFFAFFITSLVIINGPKNVDASFWDGIPIISQIKSGFQAATGDLEGAKKTQENFSNQAPVISQAKSAIESASGDNEAARKTQEHFLHETLEPVADNTPVIGHIKGGIHIAAGDEERGKEILKGASTSTAAVIGGILGGPGGAIAAGAATDGLITGIDSAINKEYTPFGVIDYVSNIDKASAGDHFDQLLGIGTEFVGGKAARNKPGGKNSVDGGTFGVDGSKKRTFTDLLGITLNKKGVEQQVNQRRRLNSDIPDSRIDLTNPTHLQIARRRTGLSQTHINRLEPIDFRVINDVQGNMNCYYCSLAALKRKTVTELRREIEIDSIPSGAPSIAYIEQLYRRAGFPDAKAIWEGTPSEFLTMLDNNLSNGESTHFSLAFRRNDDTGHVIHARAWKSFNGDGHLLTTDFQKAPYTIERFSTGIPDNAKRIFIIFPMTIRQLGDVDLASRMDIYQKQLSVLLEKSGPEGHKCSNGKRIIGYVPNWSRRPFTIEQSLSLTNAIYAFMEMSSDGSLKMSDHRMSKERLIDLVIARKVHIQKGLSFKVSFAIGGWVNSQHLSNILNNADSRNFLINEIERTINQYQLDGVDIDWEYPVTGGATEGISADKENYVIFLRELRQKLGDDRLISIAAGAGQEAFTGYDVPNILKYVDWINVMTYDFFGAWDSQWGAYVGPNSPLHYSAPSGYSGKLNVNWAIKQYVCAGKETKKIVVGIPFYGRFWYKTSIAENPKYPLYRKAEKLNNDTYGGSAAYWQIVDEWNVENNPAYETHWDDLSKTPWATDGQLVLSYDNAESIAQKVQFANEHSLGGVMIWSVDQDDMSYKLLNAVFSGACHTSISDNGANTFKCNPIGSEKRWWTWLEDEDKAGMCGKNAPLYKGYYPLCDPDDPGYSCCSGTGFCGSGDTFCDCPKCVDYGENPELIVKEPVKPSRPIKWHIGFDLAKSGEPRCGETAPKLATGDEAICNPDGEDYCCSTSGYCGSGEDFCDCDGCVNHRTGKKSNNKRWYSQRDGDLAGRCGQSAPKINGNVAICNPRDPGYHCCSASGYCGSGNDYCKCDGCVDYAK